MGESGRRVGSVTGDIVDETPVAVRVSVGEVVWMEHPFLDTRLPGPSVETVPVETPHPEQEPLRRVNGRLGVEHQRL
jgi:hypothetical protein